MPIIHSLDGTKHHPFVTPGGSNSLETLDLGRLGISEWKTGDLDLFGTGRMGVV